jgi:hypothetical protein
MDTTSSDNTNVMETTATTTKHCTKCGRDLPTSSFCRKSSSKDGLQTWCKECHTKARRSNFTSARIIKQDNPLSAYTPRELMQELYARGYKGSLTYTKVIDISKL